MIRHPLGFVSSIKRLNWQFDFSNWSNQKTLMKMLPPLFRDQVFRYAKANEIDIIDQAILMWNAIYSVVYQYWQQHPDWKFVKHEQLASDPLNGFQELYNHCGLTWNEKARAVITAYSCGRNPRDAPVESPNVIKRYSKSIIDIWRERLSKEEIERVVEGTQVVASLFYQDVDDHLAKIAAG